ncbi:MAG: DUF2461 domain-containing protein [Deltaproteobacteria bacterium]|jgi:uncharacterized protein (TIGR02453 family)|nr:DUF2461 domain-containing protein [Deltaproteobacteria bacterium]MBW2537636.1 DUF2461 domain-containing protein [Deltaproteobacteria bacterium]
MAKIEGFDGFSKGTVSFFRALSRNNDKGWFDAHRADYDEHVMGPARAFVTAMGAKLRKISPDVQAEPKVNGSIFRINRDTRFSKDKSPYKTNMGIFFWEGKRPRMECPGYYFHFEPPNLMLGVGLYQFPKDLLGPYREAVVDKKRGAALVRAIKAAQAKGPYELGGQHYKKVPRGFDADHPRADLLRHGGIYLGFTQKLPPELTSPKLVDWCLKHYRPMASFQRWLVQLQ